MKEVYPSMNMETRCGLFGITRQAWYQHQKYEGRIALEHEIVLKTVRELRIDQPKVGVRKLYLHLVEPLLRHGIEIGRDALFDLMREQGMLIRRRKRKHITTDSNHPYRKYPNLIKAFITLIANELWVSDITYIETKEGFMYLSLITDAYSHKIVGWHLNETLETKGPLLALNMALAQRTTKRALIHHSDRGVQYCCHDYTNLLSHPNNQIKISMTENGDPYENALAERVNGILKGEFLPAVLDSKQQARELIGQSIKTYNEVRLHSSINFMTPQQAHLSEGLLAKKWKPKIRMRPQPSEANFNMRPPDAKGQALRVFEKKSPPSYVG
jgi:transposase InsO family protein